MIYLTSEEVEKNCQILWTVNDFSLKNNCLAPNCSYFYYKQSSADIQKISDIVLATLETLYTHLSEKVDCPIFFFEMKESHYFSWQETIYGIPYLNLANRIKTLPQFLNHKEIQSACAKVISQFDQLSFGSNLNGLSQVDREKIRNFIIKNITCAYKIYSDCDRITKNERIESTLHQAKVMSAFKKVWNHQNAVYDPLESNFLVNQETCKKYYEEAEKSMQMFKDNRKTFLSRLMYYIKPGAIKLEEERLNISFI